jgi:hypothetical protein
MPILVAGIGLLVIDYYNPFLANRDLYNAVYVLLCLLLLGRLYFVTSRTEWKEKGIAIDSQINFDLSRTLAVSGLALVMVAWNVPVVVEAFTPGTPIQEFLTRTWDSFNKRLSNAVVNLNSPAVVNSDFYGDTLALGTGSNLGDEVLFSVQVNPASIDGARFYWRGHSYDYYKDGQWKSSLVDQKPVPAGKVPFTYPEWKDRKQFTLTVSMRNSILRTIYSAGVPLSISRGATALLGDNGDGTVDLTGILAAPQLRAGESFRVVSWVSVPTIKDLQSAGTDYPDWVKKYYLQTPENLPSRVKNLAKSIVAGKTTPLDQVMAVTQYLRQNITYEDTVPNPPANREMVDWFLFDYKKGFCNYYATSEVMLLRSLGIPARLSVGYAEGESEVAGDLFLIRSRDSHAWPEIYFPGFGWVEFEPTVSQPATGLLQDVSSSSITNLDSSQFLPTPPIDEGIDQFSGGAAPGKNNSIPIGIIIVVPLFGVAGIALFFLIRSKKFALWSSRPMPTILVEGLEKRGITAPKWLRWWANRTELMPIERLFQGVGWMVRLLGNRIKPNFTPFEQISLLTQLAPETKPSANILLEEYQKAIYSRYPVNIVRANSASSDLWRTVGRSWIKQRTGR